MWVIQSVVMMAGKWVLHWAFVMVDSKGNMREKMRVVKWDMNLDKTLAQWTENKKEKKMAAHWDER